MKRLAVVLSILLLALIGCMGGGGGDGVAGPADTLGHITGKLTLQPGIASLHASSTKSLALVQPEDAVVFLEENTSMTAIPAADGSYDIGGIPFGSYYVLARIRAAGGTQYKIRSIGQAVVNQSAPTVQVNLSLGAADRADQQTRLLIFNPTGQAIANCNAFLWGEPFSFISNGVYISPYMPIGCAGSIYVEPQPATGWQRYVFPVSAGTFKRDELVIIGVSLIPEGSMNHPPVVQLAAPLRPSAGNGAIALTANAIDIDGDSLDTAWSSSNGHFAAIASYSATWIAPSDAASATITFAATEVSGSGPRLSAKAQLVIYVRPPDGMEVPGEVTLFAPRKLVEIIGTATSQIAGNTIVEYIASITWPSDVTPTVSWTATRGTPTSMTGTRLSWKSPTLEAGRQDNVVITLVVQDATTKVERTVTILVTSLPIVQIVSPLTTQFEAGSTVAFRGSASDFQGGTIRDANLTWFVATGSQALQAVASGSRDFSYRFTARGSHQVVLNAVDTTGVSGTATMNISIINARPVAKILSPADQAGFQENVAVSFQGSATDFEDGSITTGDSFGWSSDKDGFLGSGTTVTRSNLSSNVHRVTLSVTDSDGATGIASIVVRINMPPVMDFTPPDNAVIFTGQTIAFTGVGTDTDNSAIFPDRMNWYLDGSALPWTPGTGTDSFSIPDGVLTAGEHLVRLAGTGGATVGSVTHAFTIGAARSAVTTPSANTRFDPGATITCTGVPASVGLLTMEWWENWNVAGAVRLGQNTPLSLTLPIGRHVLTYVGTDSQNVVSTSSVSVVVERLPQMAVLPASGSVLFVAATIPFTGMGTDTNNASIPVASMTWRRDGLAWKTATSSFNAFAAEFPGGTPQGAVHTITLAGEGPFGSIGSVTYSLRTGVLLASITQPLGGQRIDPVDGVPVTLTAVPDLTGFITMQWYRDYGEAGQQLIGNGPAATDNGPISQGFHTYTYIGTDSLGSVSSSTVRIAFEPIPLMDFTPASGCVFFTNSTIPFRGIGTDTDGTSLVTPDRMTWYIDSRGVAPWKTGTASFDILSGAETAGTRRVTLVGRSMLGAADGTAFKDITIEYPLATITSPASGTRVYSGASVNLAGSPPSHISMPMQWWRSGSVVPLGTGGTLNGVVLPDGLNTVAYIGTDSQGTVSSGSIQIIVQNDPLMQILPASGAIAFSGVSFSFVGSGTEAGTGLPVSSATMQWYRGATLLNANSPYAPAPGDLVAGWNVLELTGRDSLGILGSTTSGVYFDYSLPGITNPASGTPFNPGELMTLTGTPNAAGLIPMAWWLDYGMAGSRFLGNTTSISTNTLSVGWHYISYIGTDTFNNGRRSDIMVLVQDKPIMEIIPATGSWLFNGPLTLGGSGTEAGSGLPIDGATMRWFRDLNHVTVWQTGPSPLIASGSITGWRRIELSGVDAAGITGTTTAGIHFDVPRASIVWPASGTRYDIGQAVDATGTPDSVGSITMEWWADYGRSGASLLGNGRSLVTTAISPGWHYLTYIGTDSLNRVSSSEIMVLVQNRPVMEIIPATSSWLFMGPLTLTGSGTEAGTGNPVDGSTMNWYLDSAGAVWKTGNAPALASGALSGWHRLTLTGMDSYGLPATATVGMTFGVPVAAITWPASGSWYDTSKTLTATGSPASIGSITMQWWLDYSRPGATLLGTGDALSMPVAGLQGWHYLTYIGTDSMSRASSAEIMFLVQDRPTVGITPASGSCLFGGSGVTLTGIGTEASSLLPLDPAKMKWYIDGAFWKNGSPNAVAPAEVATGGHLVGLVAVDAYGVASAATSSIYFGYPLPGITSPSSGDQFASATVVAFSATPPSTDTITMKWYDGAASFASGNTTNYGPPVGLRTISYAGTDSLGRGATATIQIILNNPPSVSMKWNNGVNVTDGDIVFGGHAYSLIGAGTQSTNIPVASANLKWYLDGNPSVWKTGTTVNLNSGDLSAGIHEVILKGTDDFNSVGSITRRFYSGYPTSAITSPTSGTRIDTGLSTTFTGAPDSSGTVVMNWYWDTTTNFGSGQSVTDNTIASGWRTISYVGTDSTSFMSSSSISLFVNRLPVATITITAPAQYATAPAQIQIYLASSGTPIQLSVAATDYEYGAVPAASLTWFWPTLADNRGSGYSQSFNVDTPGTQTAVIQIRDTFGSIGTATFVWWVWDAETYPVGLSNPTGIGANGTGMVFVANASGARVVKYDRNTTAGLTTSGDLTLSALTGAASMTNSLSNLFVAGDGVYSLETDVAGWNRLQKFDFSLISNPAATPLIYFYSNGSADGSLTEPSAVYTDASSIYIADKSNGRIVRHDINNNNYVSKNIFFGTPSTIRAHPTPGWIFVGDRALNRVTILDSSLNSQGSFGNATNVADIAYGSEAFPKVYISDDINDRIIVLDTSGKELFTFGATGGGLGQFDAPWGLTIVGKDLYIVENGSGRIHRLRGGGW